MRYSPGDQAMCSQGFLLTGKGSGANLNANSSTYITMEEKSHGIMIKAGELNIGEVNQLPNKKV